MAQRITHPLDEAYFRLDWAKKRLAELKAVHETYIAEEADIISESVKANGRINEQGNPEIRFPQPRLIPVSFPILVGEVAYNLRASLDYLIYKLAILDSGSEQQGTQFPVTGAPENFRGRNRNRYLRGVNDTHAEAIERLQPYNGVDWTKKLVSVSNPDKHRHLIVSRTRNAMRVRYGNNPNPPEDYAAEDSLCILMTLTNDNGRAMYIEFEMVLFIAFDDGRHVINTLEEIETGVRNTLADFKPEF
jgi:hypothetical protein